MVKDNKNNITDNMSVYYIPNQSIKVITTWSHLKYILGNTDEMHENIIIIHSKY